MSKSKKIDESAKIKVSRDVKMTLLTSAVSATLRLVIPVMGFFLLGLTIDAILGQVATWAIVGVVVGFVIAAYLVYRQIRKIQKDEANKTVATETSEIESEKVKEESLTSAKPAKKTSTKTSSTKKTSTKKSPEEKAE
jgi:positive regulator of sigma E activity